MDENAEAMIDANEEAPADIAQEPVQIAEDREMTDEELENILNDEAARLESGLSQKQWHFAWTYHGNPVTTALAVGYAKCTAKDAGKRLLGDPKILAIIAKNPYGRANRQIMRQAMQSIDDTVRKIASVGEILEKLSEFLRDKDRPDDVRLKSADMLLKAQGAYVIRGELSGPQGEPIKVLAAQVTPQVLMSARKIAETILAGELGPADEGEPA